MKKRLLALLLVFAMLLPVFNVAAFADDDTSTTPNSVTVYFSVTHDDSFVDKMAMKKITVPYFDIANYGLEDFYFSSERYTSTPGWGSGDKPSSDLTPGTKEYAEGQITMLHLFIYALELYKLNCPVADAGTGLYYRNGKITSNDLSISGSVGSMFMNYYWGMDLNLNYYKNYEYPLASSGWGATADQILLHDGDVVTLGHFSSYSFYSETNGIFGYIQPTALGASSVIPETTVTAGTSLDVTLYHAGASESGDYTTAHTPFGAGIPVYCCDIDGINSGSVSGANGWEQIGVTDANGKVTVDTAELGAGTYMLAMPGQKGVSDTSIISCTPGGLRLIVN